jgi:hypothetical protein
MLPWESLVHGEFQRKVWSMLFFAISWSIWILRNVIVFNNKQPDYELYFLLILTRLCVWIMALYPAFSYCALDLLISPDGLDKWMNVMKIRPSITWSAPKPKYTNGMLMAHHQANLVWLVLVEF